MFKYIYEKLWVVIRIDFWTQLYHYYPYSESFDKWCRESLENDCDFTDAGLINTVTFNGRVLWVGISKTGCFHLMENRKPFVQPSRYTKGLLWKKYKEYVKQKRKTSLDSWV